MSYFAKSLKILRSEASLSMQALADKAQISKSMICKIERDEVQPTLDVAARLAKALEKSLSEMLHAPHNTSVVFLPISEQAVWEGADHIKRRNISPVFEGLKIEWLQVELPAGVALRKCASSKGIEKYVLVISGTLEIKVNQETFRLTQGDSLYFDASCHHEFSNSEAQTVKYYIVIKHA